MHIGSSQYLRMNKAGWKEENSIGFHSSRGMCEGQALEM